MRNNAPGAVQRLCPANEDRSILASGDERGIVALWDLAPAELSCEARLHEAPITGLQHEDGRLISTSRDTYIMIFDMAQQGVVDRGVPKSCTCGSGVPNTVLTLGGEVMRKLVLVGGGDGKMRVWAKDDGPLRRTCTLPCKAQEPSQITVLPDGYRVVVSTVPADPVQCGVPKPPAGHFSSEFCDLIAQTLQKELEAKKINLETAIANFGEEKSDESELKLENQGDLKSEMDYKASIKVDCDWVLKAFTERAEKRQAELSGLVGAKEFLAGYDETAFLDKRLRR